MGNKVSEPATQKQLDYIASLAKQLGWGKAKELSPSVRKLRWSNFQRRWCGEFDIGKDNASRAIDKLVAALDE
jgi:hypothetical protein